MFKNNQKGAIDFIFIAALAIVLSVGGLVYWKISNAKEVQPDESTVVKTEKVESDENSSEIESIPEGWTQFSESGASFYHPSAWNKSDDEVDDPLVLDAVLEDPNSSLTANIFVNSNAQIFYSSNAPVYCELINDEWVHFDAYSSSDGSYAMSENNDNCKIEQIEYDSGTGSAVVGGALGQTRYSVALPIEGGVMVLVDVANHADFDDPNSKEGEERTALIKKVDDLATEFLRNN